MEAVLNKFDNLFRQYANIKIVNAMRGDFDFLSFFSIILYLLGAELRGVVLTDLVAIFRQ